MFRLASLLLILETFLHVPVNKTPSFMKYLITNSTKLTG